MVFLLFFFFFIFFVFFLSSSSLSVTKLPWSMKIRGGPNLSLNVGNLLEDTHGGLLDVGRGAVGEWESALPNKKRTTTKRNPCYTLHFRKMAKTND